MSRRIDKLTPKTQEALRAAMAEMDAGGIKYFIDSTLRTVEEQQALFAQGRLATSAVNRLRVAAGMTPISESENKYTVTKCDGVSKKSNHQYGNAVDVVPADSRGNPYWPPAGDNKWILIAGVMRKHGFNWGGDWKDFPDMPHYEKV